MSSITVTSSEIGSKSSFGSSTSGTSFLSSPTIKSLSIEIPKEEAQKDEGISFGEAPSVSQKTPNKPHTYQCFTLSGSQQSDQQKKKGYYFSNVKLPSSMKITATVKVDQPLAQVLLKKDKA